MRDLAFASKSEAKRVITTTGGNPTKEIATINIWNIDSAVPAFGVAARVDGKGIRSQVCNTKEDILKFLGEVL